MPVFPNQQATLVSGQTTLLRQTRFRAVSVKLTGIAGEFATIPFKTIKHANQESDFFEANLVKLRFFDAIPSARILATTPEGVGSLDIVFEVRTGADAI
jgi:hypothetical protein